MALNDRAYVGGLFELVLDGQPPVGILHSVDGGHFKAESIGEKVGGEPLVTRYPGRQKVEDITMVVGSTMGDAFWKWVGDSIQNKPTRRNGEIRALDFNTRERTSRRFEDALISEIQFPALDSKSKDPKRITVKISPERISFVEARNTSPEGSVPVKKERTDAQKRSVAEAFIMAIDGIPEGFCRRITKVEAFSVKQQIMEDPRGGLLYTPKVPGRLEFPTLSFSVPESHLQPFIDWFKLFVTDGEHVQKHERNGSIRYIDALKRTLGEINLRGMGITGITFDKHDGHGEGIRNAKIDLYVEELDFKYTAP